MTLLGPSGCGKTTTLRLVAGFIDADEGQFIFDGRDYTRVPVHKRNFGYVFQSYALFPHLNVMDNVGFGLKIRRTPKPEMARRVSEALEKVALTGYEKRMPAELSGGQRQRVALARALVLSPRLLLLDEPLSNLDAKLRVQMRVEIRRIQQELKITTLYVTHDQEECFSISDQVAIMNGGVIEQLDTPYNIYNKPATAFTAKFVGFENFLPVQLDGGRYVSCQGVPFSVSAPQGEKARCACRPDDIVIFENKAGAPDHNCVSGKVGVCTFLGKRLQYMIDTPAGEFLVNTEDTQRLAVGQAVTLLFPEKNLICLNGQDAPASK
jgi:putative spermidine/putrescine transport system ATP-binding protein